MVLPALRRSAITTFNSSGRSFVRVSVLVSAIFSLSLAAAAPKQPAIPLIFEPNNGQTDGKVDFVAREPGYAVLLNSTEAAIRIGASTKTLRLKLLGANRKSHAEGRDLLAGKSNYLIGNDPHLWRTGIPQYGRITYRNVYPGIDLAYYGSQQNLEYDLILAPGADPERIRFSLEGADTVRIDKNGDLVFQAGSTEIRQRRPKIYQDRKSTRLNSSH